MFHVSWPPSRPAPPQRCELRLAGRRPSRSPPHPETSEPRGAPAGVSTTARCARRTPHSKAAPQSGLLARVPVFTFRVGGRGGGGCAPLPGRGGRRGGARRLPACLERGSGSGGSGGGAAGTGPGSSTMSGEWRPGRCHPPRPLRLPPLQLHTPAPESLRPACSRTPSRRSQFPDPCTPRSWPLVTCTFLECRVQALLVP